MQVAAVLPPCHWSWGGDVGKDCLKWLREATIGSKTVDADSAAVAGSWVSRNVV